MFPLPCFGPPANTLKTTVEHSDDTILRCMHARDQEDTTATDTIATSSHAKQPDINLDAMRIAAGQNSIKLRKMKGLLKLKEPNAKELYGAENPSQITEVLVRSAAAHPSQAERKKLFLLLKDRMWDYLSQEERHELLRNIAGPGTSKADIVVNGNSRLVKGYEDKDYAKKFQPSGGTIRICTADKKYLG